MPEHTPGYIAALAAALHQANINALVAAENGDNQLGRPVTDHPGLRIWNGNLISVGHIAPDPFIQQANKFLSAAFVFHSTHLYVDAAHHEHVRHEHLTPPAGYRDDPTELQWVHCAADADGAVPITIAVTQTHDDAPEDSR
jgi:hypothetical protein